MRELKDFNINWTYVLVAAILSIGIFSFGLLSFITNERDRKLQQSKIVVEETAKLAEREQEEKNLGECLEKAQKEFDDLLELNSYPNPQPDYPDARRWNSAEQEVRVTNRLNEDKELCLKLYSQK